QALFGLLSMWAAAELAAPGGTADLTAYRDVLVAARARFGRSGDDLGAATALFALAHLEPTVPGHRAEIEVLYAFDDDLSMAQFGPAGRRARVIELLDEIARQFPSRLVVDQLVAELTALQRRL